MPSSCLLSSARPWGHGTWLQCYRQYANRRIYAHPHGRLHTTGFPPHTSALGCTQVASGSHPTTHYPPPPPPAAVPTTTTHTTPAPTCGPSIGRWAGTHATVLVAPRARAWPATPPHTIPPPPAPSPACQPCHHTENTHITATMPAMPATEPPAMPRLPVMVGVGAAGACWYGPSAPSAPALCRRPPCHAQLPPLSPHTAILTCTPPLLTPLLAVAGWLVGWLADWLVG